MTEIISFKYRVPRDDVKTDLGMCPKIWDNQYNDMTFKPELYMKAFQTPY